jgi:hypothetical protein
MWILKSTHDQNRNWKVNFEIHSGTNIIKRKFKEWLSTIQPISTKLKIGSYPHIIEHKRDHDMWCLKSRYRLDYLKSMIIKSPKQRLETYCFCSVSY